jgi:lipopolysaccharide transport system permease protein
MAVTDLRGRYVGSSLGLFWSVIHPLVMIVVYTIVFSRVMGARIADGQDPYAYGLYLCAGLLPWIGFQEIVIRCTTIFPDNGNLVRKVAFPKSILYGYVMLSSAINLFLALAAFLLGYLVTGHSLHPTTVLWVPMIGLQLLFGLGLGILTSVVHVFFRDTAQIVSVTLQVLFWATPIVYVEQLLSPRLQALERYNPLRGFTVAQRGILLDGTLPPLGGIVALTVLTGLTLAAGIVVYRRFRGEILDEL